MDMKRTGKTEARRGGKRPPIRKIHINLPEEVHKKLRVKCALEDVTIQEWVARLIERELRDLSVLVDTRGGLDKWRTVLHLNRRVPGDQKH